MPPLEYEKSAQNYKILLNKCGWVQEHLEGMQTFAAAMGETSLVHLLENVIATNTMVAIHIRSCADV